MNEKTEKEEIMKECPDVELVSAFFDGELDKDSPEAQHISSCPACGEILESYRLLDEKIKEKYETETPEDISERIKAGVHRKLSLDKKPEPTIAFPGIFLKVAALFVLCSAITYMLIDFNSQAPEPGPVPPSNVAVNDGKNEGAVSQPPSNSVNTGVIPLEDFSAVNFGAHSGMTLPGKDKGKIPPASISPNVRQVWVVDNLKNTEDRIRKIASALDVKDLKIEDQGSSSKIKISGVFTKKQLVGMVKACAASGFELLSPQAPQPEQKLFFGGENEKVHYNADFVLDGN